MKEYEFLTDMVINLPESVDPDDFRDGLVDAIIAYVEAAGGKMGGGVTFREWVSPEEQNGGDNET